MGRWHDRTRLLAHCAALGIAEWNRPGGDDQRAIAIAQAGLTYTPRCMIVAAGQRVRWEGNLGAHPLAPGHPDDGSAGSADNPIEPKGSGSVAEFAFERPGTFPYHCTLHAFGAGQGMAGVVDVR
jgi:plastocyanin